MSLSAVLPNGQMILVLKLAVVSKSKKKSLQSLKLLEPLELLLSLKQTTKSKWTQEQPSRNTRRHPLISIIQQVISRSYNSYHGPLEEYSYYAEISNQEQSIRTVRHSGHITSTVSH
jgi:hypothetical protein